MPASSDTAAGSPAGAWVLELRVQSVEGSAGKREHAIDTDALVDLYMCTRCAVTYERALGIDRSGGRLAHDEPPDSPELERADEEENAAIRASLEEAEEWRVLESEFEAVLELSRKEAEDRESSGHSTHQAHPDAE